MKNTDEPIMKNESSFGFHVSKESSSIPKQIRKLLTDQLYGVLCTQGEGQPYGSLIAFATTDDLTQIVFGTPVSTRKYHLLCNCDHVALLIDNRAQKIDNMMEIEAITATGRAIQVDEQKAFNYWANVLISKHPHLKTFVYSSSTALFRIQIIRYFHVSSFQVVHEWIPQENG